MDSKAVKLTKVGDSHYVVNAGRLGAGRLFRSFSGGKSQEPANRVVPDVKQSDPIEQTVAIEQTVPIELGNVPRYPAKGFSQPKKKDAEPVSKQEKKPRPQEKPRRKVKVTAAGVGLTLKSLLLKALVVSVLGATAWAVWTAYQQGDSVAAVAVILVAVGALFGFWRGIVGTVISLIGFVAAYLTAPQLGVAYEQLTTDRLGTTGILNRAVTIGLAGIVVFVVFKLVSSLVWKVMTGPSSGRSAIDRILGLAGGAAQAAFCILLFLGGFSVIKPALPTAAEVPEEAVSAQRILTLSNAIDASQLKPWVEQYNPFEKVTQFEKISDIQQAISKLDGPDRVRHLMRHPAVMSLRKAPEMKKAVAGLAGEQEIVELMTGKRPFDKQAVGTLLQSDAVLNLIEQPGFLEAAKDVLIESPKKLPASKLSDSESTSTRTQYTSKQSGAR